MPSDRVQGLRDQLETSLQALVTGDDWQSWLATASKFHKYSFNNQLLILAQCPEATMVAGFNTWKSLNRHVVKGSKSIGILAPLTKKVRDEAGNEKSEMYGFRCVSVFDVSQTDGDPLPVEPRATLLQGDAPEGLWNALEAIASDNGYVVERGDCGTSNGYTMPSEKRIRVRDDVSNAQAAKTGAHEICHMLLHTDGDSLTITHRGIAEVEAESVAYIVANYYGIVSETYSLPYVASWSNGDMALVRATAQRVTKTAQSVIDAVDAA
jgi:DNA primase